MKKLLLFAAAAMTFAACSTDTTEDIAVLPDGTLRVSFSDDDSRVQLDENSRTVWNEGDQISVFNKTDGNECWRFDGKTGDTVGTISRVSGSAGGSAIGKIFAVYPYAESNAVSADGTITTEIPATQKYCADSYGVGNNIMVASSESGDLAFKNALGWIKIRLSGTETVKSLVLEGNDGETLTGTATIDADLTVSLAADAAKSLTLDCSKGVTLSSDPTAFYFAVVPQVFEKGITVTAHYSDGSTFEKSTDKTITVERNHIVPMTKFDATVIPNNQIWYTTTNSKIIEPRNPEDFGASIISNTYKDGKGIIMFNGDITHIPKLAFFADNSHNMTSITIPDSIVSIGDSPFLGCNGLIAFYGKLASSDNRCLVLNGKLIAYAQYGLTSYTIPDNITTIGYNAFSNCNNLTSITISDNVKTIEDYAFAECLQLTDITIPDSVISIGNGAFANCGCLTDISIPKGVTAIRDWSFLGCVNLTNITISDSVTSIGSSAFRGCTSLTNIVIPDGVNTIGNYAFLRCDNLTTFYGKLASEDNRCLIIDDKLVAFAPAGLTEYTIPANVIIIGDTAFYNCSNLKDITLPDSVTAIGIGAFQECKSLAKIKMSDNVTEIGLTAFSECCGLTNITIPNSICSIGECAFSGCTNLMTFYGKFSSSDNRCLILDGKLIAFAPYGLTEYTIPDNVTIIGWNAFANCNNLTDVIINNNIKIIGDYAFYNCKNLTNIYCKNIYPPKLEYNTFNNISSSANIYVPQQSIDKYTNAPDWQQYSKYIVGYEYADLPDIPEPDYYISSDYSADGTVQTLQKATVGRGIDIILMGDAFSDRQIAAGDYDTAMRQAADNLFTEEPYKSFRNMFNVYAVTAVSATEGYEHENTAFSGYFGDGTIVGGNDAKAFEYAQKAIAAERMDDALIVVMMNSQEYAGTCYMYYPSSNSDYGRGVSVAYFPLGTDNDMFAQLLHHEACGHGFAKLADEYAYEYMGAVPTDYVSQVRNWQSDWGWYKNVDFTSDPATVKWHTFLSDPRYANEGLGVFEGGATYWTGVWRPTENSIMRYNTGGFNAPSREAIYYRIHKLAYGESWNYDYEDFVAYDAVNRKASAGISFSTPIVPKDFVPLAPPVVVGKSWRDAR